MSDRAQSLSPVPTNLLVMSGRDDPRDPFDELFREIERVMNEMIGGSTNVGFSTADPGFGSDTHVDVHERDEEIRVIADLPGVEKEDIRLKCDGRVLTISADSDRRTYDERIDLPARVDETSARASYNNGVLEVVLEREERSADIDVE